jgi:hypothetical protein
MILGALVYRPRLNQLLRFIVLNHDLVVPVPAEGIARGAVVIKHRPLHLICVLIKPPPLLQMDIARVPILQVVED